ncbi:hypothetical protein WMY93_008049 [Mugilogobius chulae]|uniref:von Willebrand factor A domain-containing protein 7-like n=1 Tax=Mugilogobius chulae TaxID=88201 RepID=A0AAW0PTH1_9GOBI
MSGLFLLTFLFLLPGAMGFKIIKSPIWSHQEITERAILNVTTHACRAVAEANGLGFTFPASLTLDNVLAACSAKGARKKIARNISKMRNKNAAVDLLFLSSKRHFDDEDFVGGKKLITDGLDAVKASIKKDNMKSARDKLAKILHTLQDFYSHSNWIELGNDKPNSNVISKSDSIGNIADKNRPTCRDCDGNDCTNNILENILRENILTSGYFLTKPIGAGKCSHGGFPDTSALFSPKGGINKDTSTSSHGHLHDKAATVAVAASSELLNDVRGAAGDREFLRMLGIVSGNALCFVIDTTGSMGDDIAAVREATAEIINKRLGTTDEPSVYILVPFNDPDFGPLMRTTDPEAFKKAINALTPHDGGDAPEMSLSGLQLALTNAPYGSEIYLFTDAGAKDAHLKSTVIALIERTESVVNFMLTSLFSSRRRRADSGNQQTGVRLSGVDSQVYKDLAVASGGQAVEVTKSQLLEATNAILETSTSFVVTLLQTVRDPGKPENFTFTVDETVTNLTIYITGTGNDFSLISPTGVVQESTSTTGSLITSTVAVGNLKTLMLKTEVGLWEMRMRSTNPYNLKITARTPIDFFFSFMQSIEGPSEGYIEVENRPKAGANGTMSVKLLGSDTANVTEVTLVFKSGSGQVKGTIVSQDNGQYLVQFDKIPSQEFTVVVRGQISQSSTRSVQPEFQRQSTTNIRASSVSVTTSDETNVIEPGATLSVNFTVSTNGSGGTFTIRATNDQSFTLTFPSTLEVASGGSTVGTLQLTAPSDTDSGTVVTLTIEAQSPDGDVNYVVLTVTVLKEVTDVTRPTCELLSIRDNCTQMCSNSTWELSVRLSDGENGTGIERVYVRQGSGTFNKTVNTDNDTIASYEASCCSSTVDIVAVDVVGNASLTLDNVLAACSAQEARRKFGINMFVMKFKNADVDSKFLSSQQHFDDENFDGGKKLITDGLDAVKASIKKDNMNSARDKLAEILHTLQDFYSHSNWIELGNDKPNSNVISKSDSIGKIADKNRPTCKCEGDVCTNQILPAILTENVLTSGYYMSKPTGKCRHGDIPGAKEGINKDTLTSSHGHLHDKAATVAVAASSELLNDVRGAAGDSEFLRMLGVVSGNALCFVIDTTGSMYNDIAAVREVTAEIINKRLGTTDEPSVYILVPFNDPDFGPLMRTTDPEEFKKAINALTPNGGGDLPEMSLSGLQLALTNAPYGSTIFLFTDAAAKDAHLKSTVTALIERTESEVNFMITSFSSLRRRRADSGNQQTGVRLSGVDSQVYKDLAVASGGQAVEVTKSQLLEATNAVLQTSTSNVVTLLQTVRDPGKSENFTFTVDETVTNLTIYITGTGNDFSLISPTGVVQESTSTTGSLITSTVAVGNLKTLMLKTEVGLWEMRMRSTNSYNLKIIARTPIDFFFSFMQSVEGPSEGYIAVENRPKAGANGTMSVTLLGSDTANVTEVILVFTSGSGQVKGMIVSQDNGQYLVQFDKIPSEEFTVVVRGQISQSSARSVQSEFQRQSTTNIRASSVSVTTVSIASTIEIKVMSNLVCELHCVHQWFRGNFTIRATNDQSFTSTFPSTLEVASGGSTVGTLQLTAPSDTDSGTVVTLTIEAQSPDGDVNYVVLTVTVLKEVTDVTRPTCELLSIRDNCTQMCSNSTWELSVRLSDGENGTGIERVYVRQGSGTFNKTVNTDNDTIASYEASCCSSTVDIVAVDVVGNRPATLRHKFASSVVSFDAEFCSEEAQVMDVSHFRG